MILVIIISLIAPIFWDKYEALNFVFQKSQLLNIITNYSQNMYHKHFYYTFFLEGEEYIREFIITAL